MSTNTPIWKLKSWINFDYLDWDYLSLNPRAIKLLEKNSDKINWGYLSYNEGAIELLKKNPDKINWNNLNFNNNAYEILSDYYHKINWTIISTNPRIMDFYNKFKSEYELILNNPLDISWIHLTANENAFKEIIKDKLSTIEYNRSLCTNPNEEVIEILNKKNLSKTEYHFLNFNKNPKAVKLLETNCPEKINWYVLSSNEGAIETLKRNLDKINWCQLSRNTLAMEILEKNKNMINWHNLSANPSIFELDYEAMKINNEDFYEDLIKEVMKPSRVFKERDYDYLEELFGD